MTSVLDADDRRQGWARHRAAHREIFDVYFGNRYWGGGTDLDLALQRWGAGEARLRRLAGEAPAEVRRAAEAVAAILDGDRSGPECVLFVGLFGANGFEETVNGVPTVFLALERVADRAELGLLATHEAAHALHAGTRAGEWPDGDPLLAAFSEGLALEVSARAWPGLPPQDHLWMRSPLAVPLADYAAALEKGAAELLAGGAYERFFNYDPAAPPSGIPPRFGYYAGWRVVERLARKRPLAELARWPARVARAETMAALRALPQ